MQAALWGWGYGRRPLFFAVGASGEGSAVSRRRRMVKGNERIQKIVKENGRKEPESGKKVAI